MKRKLFAALALLSVLILSFGGVVYACAGTVGLYYGIDSTYISATIVRCNCAPVNNFLYASTRAQYLMPDGVNYAWTGWNVSQGNNVYSKQSFTYANNLYCGYCHYRWECYTGASGRHMQEHLFTN